MMPFTLVHDYDMIEPIAAKVPADLDTLDELATALWDLDVPGLT